MFQQINLNQIIWLSFIIKISQSDASYHTHT
jgi:hypothetical protein